MGFLDKFNIQAGKTEAEKSKESESAEKPERQSELLDGNDFSVDDLYKVMIQFWHLILVQNLLKR